MKHSKPLARSGRLRRTAPIKAKGKSRFPKRRDPIYTDWVRQQPCLLTRMGYCGEHHCLGRVQVCHVKSRGAGGDDHANVVPLCGAAHFAQHSRGIQTCQREWGVDLHATAAKLYERYQSEVGS
jgi:hypothetical protein